jgi:UDP-hydrolysing UDP-N-acetyl-D-glucosamine 2-epimerase
VKRIGVVTVARSDFNYWTPVLHALAAAPDFEPFVIAAAAHLSPRFGNTADLIEQAGFTIAARVPMTEETDDATAIVRSMARGLEGFAQAYATLDLDAIAVLGDRFETHAAAVAAVPLGLPIIHLHGGEETEGAIDNVLRHSITKLASVHCVAHEVYAQRVRQMGEDPSLVFVTGAPALDLIRAMGEFDLAALEERVGRPLAGGFLIGTYHPVTTQPASAKEEATAVLGALPTEIPTILTMPNADTGGLAIRAAISEANLPHVIAVENLGARLYYTGLRHARAMVGNSSSGILEAPSFALPVVNIGDRQAGRMRAPNVIDTDCDREQIRSAILRALSPEFRGTLHGMTNPYGDGHAAAKIVEALRQVTWGPALIRKRFHEVTP